MRNRQPHNPVSLIIPSLYLGPCSAASSKQFITSNSITDVLSIGANPSPQGERVNGVGYSRLSANDSTSFSISIIVGAGCETIDSALRKRDGKILVHCSAGISRSPTVVAAYLMKHKGMTLKAALGHIIRVRPQVSPNAGFLKQLKELELELFGTAVSSLEGVDELPRRERDRLALFEEGESEEAGKQKTVTASSSN